MKINAKDLERELLSAIISILKSNGKNVEHEGVRLNLNNNNNNINHQNKNNIYKDDSVLFAFKVNVY